MPDVRQIVEEESARDWLRRQNRSWRAVFADYGFRNIHEIWWREWPDTVCSDPVGIWGDYGWRPSDEPRSRNSDWPDYIRMGVSHGGREWRIHPPALNKVLNELIPRMDLAAAKQSYSNPLDSAAIAILGHCAEKYGSYE